MKSRTSLVALAILLPAALLQEDAAADTTFSDGTFNNSDWSLTLQTSGNGGTSNATQVTSGGNPGSYYRVTIQTNGDGSGAAAFYLNNNFNFTPSSQGAVMSLDFAFDLSTISGAAFAEVESCKMETSTFLMNSILRPPPGPIFHRWILRLPILV